MSAYSFLSGEVEDVLQDTAEMNKLMSVYPVGSGLYGQLRQMEQRMTSIAQGLSAEARNSVEGHNFLNALRKLKALHKSEADIKSQQAIERGISTQAKEEVKKERYEEQRAFMEIEPLTVPGENLMPILIGVGVIGGAYLLLKG